MLERALRRPRTRLRLLRDRLRCGRDAVSGRCRFCSRCTGGAAAAASLARPVLSLEEEYVVVPSASHSDDSRKANAATGSCTRVSAEPTP